MCLISKYVPKFDAWICGLGAQIAGVLAIFRVSVLSFNVYCSDFKYYIFYAPFERVLLCCCLFVLCVGVTCI
jgi:hypothetical protein